MKTIADPAAKAEILERIHKLTPDATRRWGKMTVHQMICHLNDSQQLAMGQRKFTDKSNLFSRTVMKWGALRAPMKWPPGVSTVRELDQAAGQGTPPAIFEVDRTDLVRSLERFAFPARDFQFAPHPMFMHLTEWEWMRWSYLHFDHHLRQFGV